MSVSIEVSQSERPGAAHLAGETVVNNFADEIELPHARAGGRTILVVRRANQQHGSVVLDPGDDPRLITREWLSEFRDIRGLEAAFTVVQKDA